MPESSLFDEPVGPPEPPPEPPPAKRGRRPAKPKNLQVPRDSDADLDQQLHEQTPDTFDPGYEGHRMRVAGRPWTEVATRIGSASPASAMSVVSRYLQAAAKAQSSAQLQEALQTQVDRYETILAAWWSEATEGRDEKAAGVVLRAMERLDRVLRLTESDVTVARETIVVSPDPASYVKQLKAIVEERDARSNGQPPAELN